MKTVNRKGELIMKNFQFKVVERSVGEIEVIFEMPDTEINVNDFINEFLNLKDKYKDKKITIFFGGFCRSEKPERKFYNANQIGAHRQEEFFVNENGMEIDQFIDQFDKVLEFAKETGRNVMIPTEIHNCGSKEMIIRFWFMRNVNVLGTINIEVLTRFIITK